MKTLKVYTSFPDDPAEGAEPPDQLTVIACPSIWTALMTPDPFGVMMTVNETTSPLLNVEWTPVKLTVWFPDSLSVLRMTFPSDSASVLSAANVVPVWNFSTSPPWNVAAPETSMPPVNVESPSTLNPTPLRSCNSSDLWRLTIVNEPLPLMAVSIRPSSVPRVSSLILPVILA